MKKLALIAAVAALSACQQKADETAATDDTTAEAPMAADTTAVSSTTPGTYDVTGPDGTMGSTVINADGTYVDTDAEGKETHGTFAVKDGKDCFDPDGDAPEECWTVSTPAADGSFTATGPDGTTVTVTPRAAATPAA